VELVDQCMRNFMFEFEINAQNLLLLLEKDPENENQKIAQVKLANLDLNTFH